MAELEIHEDWWLIFILSAGMLLLLAVNCYVVILWQHPDDKNEAYFPKAVVLFGLTLCEGSVLLLALDSENNSTGVECGLPGMVDIFCGSLNMELLWYIVFMTLAIMALCIIPYTIFFYEEDDTEVMEGQYSFRKTCLRASKYMIALVIIVGLTLGLMYYYLGYSYIPVKQIQVETSELISSTFTYTSTAAAGEGFSMPSANEDYIHTNETIKIRVSFPLYAMGLMTFVGWFLLALFSGVGFSALPIDCIRLFIDRPKKLNRGQLAALQANIQHRCSELIKVGSKLMEQNERENHEENDKAKTGFFHSQLTRRRQKREAFADMNGFKQMVYVLNEDFEQMRLCKNYAQEFNPITPVLWLITGVITGIISLAWMVHIILFILIEPPVSEFLDAYANWLQSWFPLISLITFIIFSLYLLWTCVHGCFKFGIRIVWFTLHPMKINGTYMNSFLFNVGVICICTPAVLQLSVDAFSNYLSNSVIVGFFNVQVRYLEFFHYFFVNNVFIISLLIVAVLAAIYFAYRPTDASYKADEIHAALQRLEENRIRVENPSSPSHVNTTASRMV
eukprot:27308_1